MNPDLLLILAAVSFGFFVKGIAGLGGPLLAVPIIAPTFGVEHAVVVVSLCNIVANLMLLWEHRSGMGEARSFVVRIVAAGAAGTVAGTWLLTRLDNRLLALVVAVIVLTYIAFSFRRPDFRIGLEQGHRWAWPVGAFGGLIHGATGNSGPIFGTFLHSLGLSRSSFVFALTVPFLVFGSIQVVTLVGLGAFTPDRTVAALWAIVPVVIVTPLGARISRRLGKVAFARAVLAMLTVAAIRLLLSAFGI